jgi:hypothetical protein
MYARTPPAWVICCHNAAGLETVDMGTIREKVAGD